MKTIIDLLYKKIEEIPEMCYFNPPATDGDIKHFEEELGIKLPESMRMFYMHFDGGLIALDDALWENGQLKSKEDRAYTIWNSNLILSLGQILRAINDEEENLGCGYFVEMGNEAGLTVIPLISTASQEFLLWDATDCSKTPILNAFHEYPADEWSPVYNSFEELMSDYVNKNGNIETIAG